MREKTADTLDNAVRAALAASLGEWGVLHTIISVRGKFRCVVYREAERECKRCRGQVVVTILNPHRPPPITGRFDRRLYMINEDE